MSLKTFFFLGYGTNSTPTSDRLDEDSPSSNSCTWCRWWTWPFSWGGREWGARLPVTPSQCQPRRTASSPLLPFEKVAWSYKYRALNKQPECNGAVSSWLLKRCTQYDAFQVVGFILLVPIHAEHHGVRNTGADPSRSISSSPDSRAQAFVSLKSLKFGLEI